MLKTMCKGMAALLLCGLVLLSAGCSGDKPVQPEPGESQTATAATDEFEVIVTGNPGETTQDTGLTGSAAEGTTGKKTPVTTKGTTKATATPTNDSGKELYTGLKGTTVQIPFFGEPDALGKKKIAAFENEYGAKIKYTIYGWQEYQTKILQMVGAGTPPDLTPVFDQQYLMYVGRKIIQPVTPYINAKDQIWNEELCNLYKWGNTLYGVSTDSDLGVFGIYYNKDLFEENDVPDPYEQYKAGQWTFDNFQKAAKDLTSFREDVRYVTGFACWKWDILSMANGGTGIQLVEKDGRRGIDITLDKANELRAFELIQQMQLKDKSYDYAMSNIDNYFVAGRIAMISERPSYAKNYYKGKFELGWVPLPKGPGVTGEIAPSIVRSWAVPTGAKNPEGGIAYIYSSGKYGAENAGDALVKADEDAVWPDKAHRTAYDAYMKKAKLHTSFIGGCNNWDASTRWGFWKEILVENMPPATAVAKHRNELQYEINQVLKSQ